MLVFGLGGKMSCWWLVLGLMGCGKDTPEPVDSASSTTTTPTELSCNALPAGTNRGGDGSRDADNDTAWFRSVHLTGLTDVDLGTTGASWVDLDGDGQLDVVVAREDHLEFYRNEGCFQMASVEVDLVGAPTLDGGVGGPMAVDLNQDGWLDLYVPMHGALREAQLWISDGQWDRFENRAAGLGVNNPGNYGRAGPSVGDVNNDGWLDFAVGGHQIGGSVDLGRPLPGLFVFRPGPSGFDDGVFENLAGTSAVPDFGGVDPLQCRPTLERTGLKTVLRDLDDDGDLDLLWATHNDMFGTLRSDACATGPNPYGLSVWLGDSATSEQWTEQVETPDNVVDHGRMQYDDALKHYVVAAEGEALGAEYVAVFDADNDGDRDLIAIGPSDPDWVVSSTQVEPGKLGRLATFFRNDNNVWTDKTSAAGLDSLNWTMGQWTGFFQSPLAFDSGLMNLVCLFGSQRPLCQELAVAERQPYPSQVMVFDADNDGFKDLLYVVRQCVYDDTNDDRLRSVLYHNNGDGTFEPLLTEVSGVSGCALGAFAVDLDRDGWVDLHFAVRDFLQATTNHDVVFRNRGAELAHGDRHWLRVNLDGLGMGALLGARITALSPSGDVLSNGWYEVEAWRGSREPTVHLGLGDATEVVVEVRLRDGTVQRFEDVSVDATVVLSL